jgi:hypothetical protein
MTPPAPDDPYGLGPWTECAGCHRRYRPAHESSRCYECLHPPTEPAAEGPTTS